MGALEFGTAALRASFRDKRRKRTHSSPGKAVSVGPPAELPEDSKKLPRKPSHAFYAVRAATSSGWVPVSLLYPDQATAKLAAPGWLQSLKPRLQPGETVESLQIVETTGLDIPRLVDTIDISPPAPVPEDTTDVGF